MKREKNTIDRRREELYQILMESSDVQIEDLAKKFHVSEITIRRDFVHLEKHSLIKRHYGGYRVLKNQQGSELIGQCKDQIAKYAASLVENDDILFINTSSTAIRMLSYIHKKNVIVITNNANAINTEFSNGLSVYLTGGELRYPKAALVGDFAMRNIQSMRASKCFIGCSGISCEMGMTTQNANEVNINRVMLENTVGGKYVLADHTKMGMVSSFVSCTIDHISEIITDELTSKEFIDSFEACGIIVHQASLP
ncbi:MAG: DeoR/GlpR family DNA-binding transcription regulator [Sphaerochaetaceae bacterium]